MYKIIFLDIDGVLNVYCHNRDEYGCTFHKNLEDNLKLIIDNTNAKIVISSSWRDSGLEIMKEMWLFRNLAGEILDITPYDNEYRIRGNEIDEWLNNNKDLVSNYVIIDDDSDFLDYQKPFHIKTSDNITHSDYIDIGLGLTKECALKAIKMLNTV